MASSTSYLISYDIVPKLQDKILTSAFKVVIADESHFLKNGQAKRTSSSLPILQKSQYTILLSGTPALSRPIELFKQLEALYPDVYKNVHEYGNRYCKGGIFGAYQGASNHEELHNLMKATLMIRRLKKDVLTELPLKRRQQVFLEIGEREMRQINALFHELETAKMKIKSFQSKEEADSLKFTQKNLINKGTSFKQKTVLIGLVRDVIQNKLDNLGQMLDGHENSLQVSVNRPGYSPLKASGSQPGCCPRKQTKLDFFLKRCNNSGDDDEHKHKHLRS